MTDSSVELGTVLRRTLALGAVLPGRANLRRGAGCMGGNLSPIGASDWNYDRAHLLERPLRRYAGRNPGSRRHDPQEPSGAWCASRKSKMSIFLHSSRPASFRREKSIRAPTDHVEGYPHFFHHRP